MTHEEQFVVYAPEAEMALPSFYLQECVATYGTDDNHSGDTEFKILCKECVQQ